MASGRPLSIRLSVQDADTVRNALAQFGDAGERALKRLEAASKSTGEAHKSLDINQQQVIHSGRSMIDMIASGQSPFRALTVEATKLAQGFGLLGALFNPITLGLGAVAGAMAVVVARSASIDAQIRTLTVNLKAMGDVAGVSATQLRGIAKDLQAQGLSGADATSTVQAIIARRELTGSAIGSTANIAVNMAAATGAGAAETAAKLADTLTGGYNAIKKLDEQFGFLTASELTSIRTMAEHGDRAGVLATTIGALDARFKGLARESLSEAGKALTDLAAAWDRLVDKIAKNPAVINVLRGLGSVVGGAASLAGGLEGGAPGQSTRQSLSAASDQLAQAQSDLANLRAGNGAKLGQRQDLLEAEDKVNRLQQRVDELSAQIFAEPGQSASVTAASAASGGSDPAAERSKKIVDELAAQQGKLAAAMQLPAAQREIAIARINAENEVLEKNLSGQEADRLIRLRVAEAADKQAASIRDSTRTAIEQAEIQATAAERVAAAAQVSAAAQQQAEIAAKVDNATRPLTIQLMTAQGESARILADAIERVTQATIETDAAQKRTAGAVAIRERENQVRLLEAELALTGQLPEVRERELALLREKLQIEASLPGITDQQKQRLLELAAAQGRLTGQIKEAQRQQSLFEDAIKNAANQIDNTLTKSLEAAFSGEKVGKWGDTVKRIIAQLAAQIVNLSIIRPLLGAGLSAIGLGGISSQLGFGGNLLGGLFSGGGGGGSTGVSGTGISFGGTGVSLAASDNAAGGGGGILSLLGTGSSILSLGSSLSGGSLLGSLGLGGVVDSIGSSLGLATEASNGIASFDVAQFGADAAGGGILGSTTLGSLLGGVGGGFAAGTLLNSLLGGKQTGGLVGSGVGALAGAAIGSIIPGIGTLLGGLIGGGGGGVLGGLFGPHKSVGPNASAIVGYSNNAAIGYGANADNGGNAAGALDLANTIAEGFNKVVKQLGTIVIVPGSQLSVGSFKGKFYVSAGGDEYQTNQFSDSQSAVDNALFRLLKTTSFADSKINDALAASKASDSTTLINDLLAAKRQSSTGVTSSLRQYLDAQQLSSTSSLSPLEQAAAARQQFATALTSARGGDQTALGNITTLANAVLQTDRAVNASSLNYRLTEDYVRGSLESLGSTLKLGGFGTTDDYAAISQASDAFLGGKLDRAIDLLDRIDAQLRRANNLATVS